MSRMTIILENIVYHCFEFPRNGVKYLFQRIFRKSHMSNRDIHRFHNTVARWLLPKLLDYKKHFYKDLYDEHVESDKDSFNRFQLTKSDLDEMIYALEWELSTNAFVLNKKEDNFYIKYYGRSPYPPHKENEEKESIWGESKYDRCLVEKARWRGQKGFELLGYYFTRLGEDY